MTSVTRCGDGLPAGVGELDDRASRIRRILRLAHEAGLHAKRDEPAGARLINADELGELGHRSRARLERFERPESCKPARACITVAPVWPAVARMQSATPTVGLAAPSVGFALTRVIAVWGSCGCCWPRLICPNLARGTPTERVAAESTGAERTTGESAGLEWAAWERATCKGAAAEGAASLLAAVTTVIPTWTTTPSARPAHRPTSQRGKRMLNARRRIATLRVRIRCLTFRIHVCQHTFSCTVTCN